MTVFVAGASGAIGSRLVPHLIDRGHEVIGTCRSPGNAERVRSLGARRSCSICSTGAPSARRSSKPRPTRSSTRRPRSRTPFPKNLDRSFAQTNRLRTEGTDALLAAAREAGVSRFVAQGFASMRYAREGGRSRPRTIRSTWPRRPGCARPAPR
jgi:NAD(P)-dependent dehydrogenase (short-subunit alcohol dehydrogenase family)